MKTISRRTFIKGMASSVVGIALGSNVVASAEQEEQKGSISWDESADLVIVGSGTGLFGAAVASFNGKDVIVLEKNDIIGGTTITSGGYVWVPCNRWMEEEVGPDWTEDEAFEYLKQADLFNGSSDEAKKEYIHNCHRMMEYVEDVMGYKLNVGLGFGDYDKLPLATKEGHSIGFVDPDTGERMKPAQLYPKYFVPAIEDAGNKIITGTRATKLIQDENGRVIGVEAENRNGTIHVEARKAVILSAGGFDHNEEMCKAFLRGPLFGSIAAASNVGEGIMMGMDVGANLGNMQNTLGGNVWLDEYVPDTFFEHNKGFDMGSYRATRHAILVNKHGRRFMDETAPYSNFPDAVYNLDTNDHSFTNIPAFLIFTDQHVELCGWPGANKEEKPDWVHKFDTLDELAEAYGINASNLKEEVDRFNGFCDKGFDEDFSRGTSPRAHFYKELGKIEGPPYYVCLTAPGSMSTKGGLKTNLNSQVLNTRGEVIEGLYAAGTNASAILGWTYGGGGGGVGPGFFQNFKAVNHIFELHLLDE